MTTQHSDATIRQFEMADYEAVYSFWSTIETGLGVGMSDARDEIEKKLGRDPDLFLVAEAEGRIVGTVIGGFDGRRGIVYHLAVAQQERGAGLGSRLMQTVESRLKALGCRKCYLLVLKDNSNAQTFYAKRGWTDMTTEVVLMGKKL